jgi:hypothetical protein
LLIRQDLCRAENENKNENKNEILRGIHLSPPLFRFSVDITSIDRVAYPLLRYRLRLDVLATSIKSH